MCVLFILYLPNPVAFGALELLFRGGASNRPGYR